MLPQRSPVAASTHGRLGPFYAIAENVPGMRVLARSRHFAADYNMFLANAGYADANPILINSVVDELGKAAHWCNDHKSEVAQLLSDGTGVALADMRRAVERSIYGVGP